MPNDQSHDPRVSTAGERVAQAVGLSVAAVALSEASLSGTVAHGNTVTLSDPQSRLGTRSNSQFRHWQSGSEIYLNGTQSSAEVGASLPDTTEVWNSFYSDDTSIVTANLRHGNIDQQYRALGKGGCIDARAFDNIGAENKFYLAKWVYPGSIIGRMYTLGYTSLSGTFTTNAERTRGEAVTINLDGGGTKAGYVTMVSNGVVTLEIDGGLPGGSASVNGQTVTGDSSGATLTIDTASVYGALSSTKICRIYSGEVTSGKGISVVTSHNSVIDADEYDENGYVGSLTNDFVGDAYSSVPKQWHLYELEIDFSGPTGVIRERVDNGTIAEVANIDKTNQSTVKGFYLSNIALDTSGFGGAAIADTGISEDFGEIIADNDLKRIVIGDAATLSGCTHIELQRHTAWSEGEVSFEVNQGSFSSLSGKYVFAVGDGYSELLGVAV